jgi:trigger factor
MRATAAPEEGNRSALSVEIDEAEIDEGPRRVMKRLAREVRVPGFPPRQGPASGHRGPDGWRSALRGEALREALPDFYARAVSDTEVDPIDQPEIDITSGDEGGTRSPSTPWCMVARWWPSPVTRVWW